MKRMTVLVATVLALGGCSDLSSGGSGGPYGGGSGRGDVDWENYASDVRTRIDSAAASADCAALQAEFDNAEANDAAQRDRTGDGNADLMTYIDSKLTDAGCYG